MVAFNPGEQYGVSPTPDPEYTSYRWSRTVQEPQPNKAGEILGKGIGSAIKDTGEAVTDAFKGSVSAEIHQTDDALKDARISDLDKTLEMIHPTAENNALSSYASTETQGPQKLDILSTDKEAALPNEVKNIGRYAENLTSARANGTFSQSYYDMQKYTELKRIRTNHPGMRDFVDREWSKVVGGDPANQAIASKLSDLNSWATQANTKMKETERMLDAEIKEGNLSAPSMKAGFQAGKISQGAIDTFVAKSNADKYRARVAENDWKAAEAGDKTKGLKAANAAQIMVDNEVSNTMSHISLTTNTGEAMGVSKVFDSDIASGKFDASHSLQAGAELQQARAAIMNKMDSKLHAIGDNGRSIAMDLKEEGVQKLMAERIKPLDTYIKYFTDHEHGLAFLTKQQTEARLDANTARMLDDPKIGQPLQNIETLKKIAGPGAEPMIMQWFNAATPLGKDTQAWVMDARVRTAVQPNMPEKIVTLSQHIEDARKNGTLDKEGPKLAQQILDISKDIFNPKISDEQKVNTALATFSAPDLLDKFAPDSKDRNGRTVHGQMSTYEGFGSPKMAKEMNRLSEGHPELWRSYQNFMNESFGDPNKGLFTKDVRKLYEMPSDVSVAYDTDTHNFKLNRLNVPAEAKYSKTNQYGSQLSRYIDYRLAQQTVDSINRGLKTQSNLSEYSGGDMDTYVLNLFTNMGFDPSNAKAGSIPEKMLSAIVAAKQPKETPPRGPK